MNKLIENTKSSRIKYPLISLLIGVIFIKFFIGFFTKLYYEYSYLIGINDTHEYIMIFDLLFYFSTGLFLCFFWVKFIEKRKISTLGFEKEKFFKKYLNGFTVGMFLASICTIPIIIFFNDGNYFASFDKHSLNTIILCFILFIIQAATEEIIFRGFIMPTLGRIIGVYPSIIISTILFVYLHFDNPAISLLPILGLSIAGLTYGILVYHLQSLWLVSGLHAAWNFFILVIFGSNISGINLGPTLFKTNLVGPEFLTGGSFGIEGSIIAIIIEVCFLIYILKKVNFLKSVK